MKTEAENKDGREHVLVHWSKVEPILVHREGEMVGLGTPGGHVEVDERLVAADWLRESLRVDDRVFSAVRFPGVVEEHKSATRGRDEEANTILPIIKHGVSSASLPLGVDRPVRPLPQ